jgi:hypothetical protein
MARHKVLAIGLDAYLAAPGLEPGERGVHSSSEVAPTVVQLLGVEPTPRLGGKSLLSVPVL